jgi:hypothetical protein
MEQFLSPSPIPSSPPFEEQTGHAYRHHAGRHGAKVRLNNPDFLSMPQAVMGGARAHCDSVVAFSQTDFNKQGHRHASLIMHGHDDKIAAYADSAPL